MCLAEALTGVGVLILQLETTVFSRVRGAVRRTTLRQFLPHPGIAYEEAHQPPLKVPFMSQAAASEFGGQANRVCTAIPEVGAVERDCCSESCP